MPTNSISFFLLVTSVHLALYIFLSVIIIVGLIVPLYVSVPTAIVLICIYIWDRWSPQLPRTYTWLPLIGNTLDPIFCNFNPGSMMLFWSNQLPDEPVYEVSVYGNRGIVIQDPKLAQLILGRRNFKVYNKYMYRSITSWILYYLYKDQNLKRRLATTESFNTKSSNTILDNIINETIRLHPSILINQVTENSTIINMKFSKGDCILINTPAIYIDKSIWGKRSHLFIPNRWNTYKNNKMPFVSKMDLNYQEIKLFIHDVFTNYNFTVQNIDKVSNDCEPTIKLSSKSVR